MGGKRVYELIFEIGHISKPLTKKLANGYTHKWTAFVRGVDNSKIEHCIQRVVFQLHESFENPCRELSEPPFQVKETGYAGFEIPIHIYFKNREKPNHLVFIHDLCLITNKPNEQKTTEKIKFINPNREFEKCLIKSGAQLLTVPVKNKERSDSPPAKKQKSSSLIPSKDMSKQPQQLSQLTSQHQKQQPSPQSQNHQQSLLNSNHHNHHSNHNHSQLNQTNSHNQHHNHHNNSSQNHNHHHHNNNHHHHNHQKLASQHNSSHHYGSSGSSSINSNGTIVSNNVHHHNNNNHSHITSTKQPIVQAHSVLHKPKSSSKEFIDVFGAPLVYNGNGKEIKTDNNRQEVIINKQDNISKQEVINKEIKHEAKHEPKHEPKHEAKQEAKHEIKQEAKHEFRPEVKHELSKHETKKEHHLQMIQTKISCLSDCDRLQKIVDIVEEAGEWYNLTPKKFEFDLKRLDKKTLSRIERCLHY